MESENSSIKNWDINSINHIDHPFVFICNQKGNWYNSLKKKFRPHFLGPFTKLLKKNRKILLGKIPDDSIAK